MNFVVGNVLQIAPPLVISETEGRLVGAADEVWTQGATSG